MSIMACVQMDTETSMGTRIIKIAMTGFTFAGVKSIITSKGGFLGMDLGRDVRGNTWFR